MRKTMRLAMVMLAVALLGAPAAADHHERTADKLDKAADKGGKVINDTWLTAKSKIALYADSRVAGTRVNVDTRGGVVTLRGKVDSAEAKGAAQEVVQGIEGVKSVKNELQVVAPGKRDVVAIKDENIKEQLEKTLSKDAQLRDVEIRSDAGVVILSGKAPSWVASAKASELARGTRGVRAVKNEIAVAE